MRRNMKLNILYSYLKKIKETKKIHQRIVEIQKNKIT